MVSPNFEYITVIGILRNAVQPAEDVIRRRSEVLICEYLSPYPQYRLDCIDSTDPFQVDELIRSLEEEAYALVRDGDSRDSSAGRMIFMNLPDLYRLREKLLRRSPIEPEH
jgi:hypothetical protein